MRRDGDDTELTAAELDAVISMINACKRDDGEAARWWLNRPSVISALAKMRTQAKGRSE